jgi:hypothetical protein
VDVDRLTEVHYLRELAVNLAIVVVAVVATALAVLAVGMGQHP